VIENIRANAKDVINGIVRIMLYYINNKVSLLQYRESYRKNRKICDPNYRLRLNISDAVRSALKRHNYSKHGESILKYIPYSIQELRDSLEKQFESWMNWNNHGIYRSETWDDNDPATWTWQIDHIIPHSTFEYSSMEDEEFKECWALNNLRPLSAKQNIIDGNRRNHVN
jgi:hypothetical protein